MAKYELMLILDPRVSQEDRDTSVNNLKKLFENNSVNIDKEDIWGDKKLAYKINTCDRGFYILYNLDFDGKVISPMTKIMNLDKNIFRFMFVRLDK